MIPTRQECLRLLDKEGVPDNVKQHIFQVTKIALFLGRKISRKEKVDLRLLEAACLLHDLDKHLCFGETHKHGQISGEALSKLGYGEIVPIIQSHMMRNIISPGLSTIEEKLLHYADRRVNHDKIVPVAERFEYLRKRYGQLNKRSMEAINKAEPLVLVLEKEILKKAGVSEKLEGLE